MKLIFILITIAIMGLIAWGYTHISSNQLKNIKQENGEKLDQSKGYLPGMMEVEQKAKNDIQNAMNKENERLQKEIDASE